VGYPLWPYHWAWNPPIPPGTLAGGGIPGPVLPLHVAAAVAACAVGNGPVTSQLATRATTANGASTRNPTLHG